MPKTGPPSSPLYSPHHDEVYMNDSLARRRLPHDTQRLVVTQSNDLAGSIQDMSLMEKRVLLLAAAVIRQADTELPVIRFDVSDYRRIYDIVNNNLVSDLLDVVKNITTRNIVLTHGRSSKSSYSVVNTFAVVTGPDSETGRAYGVIELHRDMAKFFLQLDGNFFSMPLLVYSSYRSNYALRMAEILASRGRGERRFRVSFAVNDLKDRLSCQHYKNFAQFRRRVLEPAQRENDEVGYLTFTWDEEKQGRKVERITFHVALKKDTWVAEQQRADVQRLALDNRLRQLGFDQVQPEYFEVLGQSRVQALIDGLQDEVRAREGTDRPVRNPGGYLRSRLEAELAQARATRPQEDTAQGETPRALQDSQARFKLADELLSRLNRARADHALGVFGAMVSEEREELIALMLKDVFSPLPTLIFPGQRPEEGTPLDERVRRMALVRLLERRERVRYEGHLIGPAAFDNHIGFLVDLDPKDRAAVIAAAAETDQVGGA